jgi:hypothetical protein
MQYDPSIKSRTAASADEIRAEAAKHAKRLHDAECLELGLKLQNADFRRRAFKSLDV